jgi:hypothetical protein
VADAFWLQKGAGGYHTAVHVDELVLFPEKVGFLFLAVDVLEVTLSIHELGDQAEFEAVVLGFAEVVAVEFEDVGVVVDFHQLNGLLLVFIQFVEIFGLYLLQGVDFAGGDVDGLVDFGVFLAGSEDLQFLEISFLEHQYK